MKAERHLVDRIRANLPRKLVILTGPRRAGKAMLARQLLADYPRAQYLNWDVPAWLDNAHKELDSAVAAAYGWEDYTPEMADKEILRRLLELNLSRAKQQ